jgi:hypothetical protein
MAWNYNGLRRAGNHNQRTAIMDRRSGLAATNAATGVQHSNLATQQPGNTVTSNTASTNTSTVGQSCWEEQWSNRFSTVEGDNANKKEQPATIW